MPAFPAADDPASARISWRSSSATRPQPVDAPIDEPPDRRVPYTHTGYNRFLDPDGYPAVKPPWGTLNAIDLEQGRDRVDRCRSASCPELVKRGRAATRAPRTTAARSSPPAASSSSARRRTRSSAPSTSDTGQVLWETSLPAGGYATPGTYSVGGKQYVVIAAGGGKMGTKSGDAYVAFALPD